jgi:hypothetical protein
MMISSDRAFCDYLRCPRRKFSTLERGGLEYMQYVCYDKDAFEIKDCVYLTGQGKIKEPRAPFLADNIRVIAAWTKLNRKENV